MDIDKSKINSVLASLCVPRNLVGFDYLSRAIEIGFEKEEKKLIGYYSKIADESNTYESAISMSVSTAVRNASNNMPKDKKILLFGKEDAKITPSIFVKTVIGCLKDGTL